MNLPDQESFVRMAGQAGLVPVYRTIIADLDTPLTIYAKVNGRSRHSFLFESMEGGEKWGRYSFIGLDPLVTFASRGGAVTVADRRAGETSRRRDGVNPLRELRTLLASFKPSRAPGLPRFYGGAVGFLGYDMVRFIEDIPDAKPGLDLPDSSFMVPRLVLIHDAVQQRLTVVCNVVTDGAADAEELYRDAVRRIEDVVRLLRSPLSAEQAGQAPAGEPHEFTSNMDRAAFEAMVERAKEYILAGDIIQVVLSQRFHTRTRLDPFLLYRSLRHINPSPYLFFLRLDEVALIGSSPEILVRLEDGDIELRPIAGTRKRGVTPEEDADLEVELLADPKERAEHLMLVDLGRNDVGRVAAGGSVGSTICWSSNGTAMSCISFPGCMAALPPAMTSLTSWRPVSPRAR
jgi:anthranilate synthase component I